MATGTNIYPDQIRAVDSYAEFNSNVINRLSRLSTPDFTGYGNYLFSKNHINVIWDGTSESNLSITPGKCIKDDIFIEIEDYFNVDMNDISFYVGKNPLPSVGTYYIVLNYTYIKSRPAPKASINILTPDQINTFDYDGPYLFLKAVKVKFYVDRFVIDSVYNFNPDNIYVARRYLYGAQEVIFSCDENVGKLIQDRSGLFNWCTGVSQEEFNAIFDTMDTTDCTVGELAYITKTPNVVAPAIATETSKLASCCVVTIGNKSNGSGLVRLYGHVKNVKVETGVDIKSGDIIFLSSSEEGKITNSYPYPIVQTVGWALIDSTNSLVDIWFAPGSMASGSDDYGSDSDKYQDLLLTSNFNRITYDLFLNKLVFDSTNSTALITNYNVTGNTGEILYSLNLVDSDYSGLIDVCQLYSVGENQEYQTWYVNNSDNEDEWENITLNNLHKFSTKKISFDSTSSDFIIGEIIVGENSNSAIVNAVSNTTLLLTSVSGYDFSIGETITGQTSGIVATLTDSGTDRTDVSTYNKLRIKCVFSGASTVYDYGILYDLASLSEVDKFIKNDLNIQQLAKDLYGNDGDNLLLNTGESFSKKEVNVITFGTESRETYGYRHEGTIKNCLNYMDNDKNYTLVLDSGIWNISSDTTIGENIELRFINGTILNIDNGINVVISGPIMTSLNQIFSGDGTVQLLKIPVVYPEWWGAKPDGTTNCTLAIQSAFDCVPLDYGIIVQFSQGTYITETIYPTSYMIMQGTGKSSSILKLKNNTNDHLLSFDKTYCRFITIRDMAFDGNAANQTLGANSCCLYINRTNTDSLHGSEGDNLIQNVEVHSAAQYGIWISNHTAGTVVDSCTVHHNYRDGIVLPGGHDAWITNTNCWNNIGCGIQMYDSVSCTINSVKCWCNGVKNNGLTDFNGSNKDPGFALVGSATGKCNDIRLVNCEAQENYGSGFYTQNCDGLQFIGCMADGNSITAEGHIQNGSYSYDGYVIWLTTNTQVIGCRSEDSPARLAIPTTNQRYGINISDCTGLDVDITVTNHNAVGQSNYRYSSTSTEFNRLIVNSVPIDGYNPSIHTVILTPGVNGSYLFNWQNPYPFDIILTQMMLIITTPGDTTSAITIGRADNSGGVINNTIISGQTLQYNANIYISAQFPAISAKNGTSDWIVGILSGANATSLLATLYIGCIRKR